MYNDSGIYVYRNKINGKLYVGQAENLKRRYNNFKNKNRRYSGQVFENARKKYGIDAFEYSILTHCPISELNQWESFYVKRLNSTVPHGYNMTSGGDSAYSQSQEFKEKMEADVKQKIKNLNPRLDVSQAKYVDQFTAIKIICPEHGDFFKIPNDIHHAGRYGGGLICPSCIKERIRKKNESIFFEKVNKKFGDEYIYDKTQISSWSSKIIVTCRKHGDFTVMMGNHIAKDPNVGGCPLCSIEKQHERKMGLGAELTKERIIKKFGNKYSFDKFAYNGDKNNVTLICEKHGQFSMTPRNLLRSYGCPKCRKEIALAIKEIKKQEKNKVNYSEIEKKLKEKRMSSQQVFLDRANLVHDNFYDYSKTTFITMHDKVTITCPIHGDFDQLACNHLNGCGCPECGKEKAKNGSKKKIIQMTTDGDIVKIWESGREITIDGKRGKYSHVWSCCTGKRDTAYGFKWKYADDGENGQKIVQSDKEGNVIKIWDSISDIHKNKPIKSTQHILRCLQGKSKTAGGFAWNYKT